MGISVEFRPVGDGDGDSIIVTYGDEERFFLHVVDGGYADVGEKTIEHIRRHYGRDVFINHMVVTHTDDDHVAGLIPIFKDFEVRALWMNRPWLYVDDVLGAFHANWKRHNWIEEVRSRHRYLVELERLAYLRGMEPREAFQGDWIGRFLVLAPSRLRYVRLIPDLGKTPQSYLPDVASRAFGSGDLAVLHRLRESMERETLERNPPATTASNESSLVQLGMHDGRNILLTADAGPQALIEAARFAYRLGLLSPPDVVQIPHQGSRRNVTPLVLNTWLGKPNGGSEVRGVAMAAVGAKKLEHPRSKVANAFMRRGYPVYIGRTDWMHVGWGEGYFRRGVDAPVTPFSYDVEAG